jgi:drug/metabolite transporter (DMT)-like permease
LGNHDGNFRTGVEAAITLMLMALVPVCIKLTSATPVTIGIFRLSVATLLMLLFLRPKSLNGLFKPNILLPLFFIGFLFALHWITYFLSIKKATASIGILGASTYGIHLIFLGWAIRNHKPGIFDFVALLLALAGTYFIIPEFSMSNNTTMGILLGVLSGFCFALLPVLHQQYAHIPERVRILRSIFICLALVLILFSARRMAATACGLVGFALPCHCRNFHCPFLMGACHNKGIDSSVKPDFLPYCSDDHGY